MTSGYRCGFVAVVGRPNVGKSTLVNALVGARISIVTPKPQTTRHRILGVCSTDTWQAIFLDTPGLHRDRGRPMNRIMNRTARTAVDDADLVLFVTEALRWKDEDADVLDYLRQRSLPVIAVLNKVDLVKPKNRLLELIAAMDARGEFAEIVPVSATRGENLVELRNCLPGYLPDSPPLYPQEWLTDRDAAFRISEWIREKLTLRLRDELPYGLAVRVERMAEEADDRRLHVDAAIWVERGSQKGIVIGKDGAMLKQVGRAARLEAERQLERPVHLNLWVRVKDNWASSERDLHELGFDARGDRP